MKSLTKQTGAAAVELAFALIILLGLTVGMINFGFLWLQNHYIANAARDGARVASIGGDGVEVEQAVKNYLKGLYPDTLVDENDFIDTLEITDTAISFQNGDGEDDSLQAVKVTLIINTDKFWLPLFLENFQEFGIIDIPANIGEEAIFPKTDQSGG